MCIYFPWHVHRQQLNRHFWTALSAIHTGDFLNQLIACSVARLRSDDTLSARAPGPCPVTAIEPHYCYVTAVGGSVRFQTTSLTVNILWSHNTLYVSLAIITCSITTVAHAKCLLTCLLFFWTGGGLSVTWKNGIHLIICLIMNRLKTFSLYLRVLRFLLYVN